MKKTRFILLVILIFIGINSCKEKQTVETTNLKNEYIKTASGLQYKILKEGKGLKAKIGDEVLLYETTSYQDGTELYSNENSENPIKVKIGANRVTKGIDEGLRGMQSGEIRLLIAPHHLVKRKFYPDNISPDSTLVIKLIVDKIIIKH
ncbi:FKBP-type peptidyl-prolyl cis-trans isomerase [Aureibaculum conchae]|uniref:FKBP-type peptidyl-prolyl cis-trans isomerase n=1 Tax=Aureibaculum sp. 2308TA14-22 TaxID=3108392 RepID=UPI00339720D8